jgi:tetratricopeptide (TPR) repeat protein
MHLLTTNQDLLFERAASQLGMKREVSHLHGRCDESHTIVTLVRDYVRGLPASDASLLRGAVNDRTVIVLGYSGRDRDIMPTLVRGHARNIVWVLHPDSKPSPELLAAQKALGPNLQVVAISADAWLSAVSPDDRPMSWPDESAERQEVRDELAHQFSALDDASAILGLGRVAEQVGSQARADQMYLRVLRRRLPPVETIRLLIARARVQPQGSRGLRKAVRLYEKALSMSDRNTESGIRILLAMAGAFRAGSKARRALMVLNSIETSMRNHPSLLRHEGDVAYLRAGIVRNTGGDAKSLPMYRRAARAYRRQGSMEMWVDARVWYSNALRAIGQTRTALRQVAPAVDDSYAYSRALNAPWAQMELGAAVGLVGDNVRAMDELRTARDRFATAGNRDGEGWSEIYMADLLRSGSDLAASVDALNRAKAAFRSVQPGHAIAWICLEHLELIRSGVIEEPFGAAASRAELAIEKIAPHPFYLFAHLLLIKGEWNRDRKSESAKPLLRRALVLYRQLGYERHVARTSMALSLATGRPVSASERQSWRRRGYLRESGKPNHAGASYFPVHLL